ncbi:hypothetical protein RB200_41735 [Streptomyces sp. PmtG]
MDAEDQVQKYLQVLDRMESMALDPSASRDYIHGIASEL